MSQKRRSPSAGVPKKPRSRWRTLAEIGSFESYRAARGNTSWGIRRQGDLGLVDLLRLNRTPSWTPWMAGQKILVPCMPPEGTVSPSSARFLLDEQVRLADGRPVLPRRLRRGSLGRRSR